MVQESSKSTGKKCTHLKENIPIATEISDMFIDIGRKPSKQFQSFLDIQNSYKSHRTSVPTVR